MKYSLLVLFFIFSDSKMVAQKAKSKFIQRTQFELGITLSTNGRMTPLALSSWQYWGFGKKRKFQLGLGPRLTGAFGSVKLIYITAPAILTSGKTGPGVFFTDNINQNIDTLKPSAGTMTFSLNIALALRYQIYKKWGMEFNIDLLGFSAGNEINTLLIYKESNTPMYNRVKSTNARPTRYNLLLISDNDIGSLNSELMVCYRFKKNTCLKAGFSFLFTEYTIDSPESYINSIGTTVNTDRYRTKSLTFGIGANHIINRKKR